MDNQNIFPVLVVDDSSGAGSMGCLIDWLKKEPVVQYDQVSQKEGKIRIRLDNSDQMSCIIRQCDVFNLLCSFDESEQN